MTIYEMGQVEGIKKTGVTVSTSGQPVSCYGVTLTLQDTVNETSTTSNVQVDLPYSNHILTHQTLLIISLPVFYLTEE